jgi:6-pyruvoyltetrahydropterin/6-carboxytetrahydropterin synthase
MFQITKQFHFSAAHALIHLPPEHKCHRLHGHNYMVVVTCRADHLDAKGFVIDYGDLKPIGDWIDQNWDHQNLNDFFAENTRREDGVCMFATAEMMAIYLFERFQGQFPSLYEVTVCETAKTTATYRRGNGS